MLWLTNVGDPAAEKLILSEITLNPNLIPEIARQWQVPWYI